MTTKPKSPMRSGDKASRLKKLHLELLTALYEDEDIERARSIGDRLEVLLSKNAKFAGSILIDEIHSLIAESRGDWGEAIRCREREIRKILELHNLATTKQDRPYVLGQYDHSDVSDRLDLLAMLYADQGDLGQAVETLKDSRSYCSAHDVSFDGHELLNDLEGELR
jgi:hypothetical protein